MARWFIVTYNSFNAPPFHIEFHSERIPYEIRLAQVAKDCDNNRIETWFTDRVPEQDAAVGGDREIMQYQRRLPED
jgi:hypothetical protein